MAETLPEGTDHVIPGAGVDAVERLSGNSPGESAREQGTRERVRAGASDLREKFAAQTGEYRTQATDKAREFAVQGKDKASGALDEVARLITDNATHIDDRIGGQYGDYARRAANAVSGAAEQLRGKDVDELVEDARSVIRKSPALALGAAAAAGFFLARVLKSNSEALAEAVKETAATDKTEAKSGSGNGGASTKSKKGSKPSTDA